MRVEQGWFWFWLASSSWFWFCFTNTLALLRVASSARRPKAAPPSRTLVPSRCLVVACISIRGPSSAAAASITASDGTTWTGVRCGLTCGGCTRGRVARTASTAHGPGTVPEPRDRRRAPGGDVEETSDIERAP
eukprot:scaffold44162_cov63-Phaeocystis_antarctica.AAC.2